MELTPWRGEPWQGALPCTECQERVTNVGPARPVALGDRAGVGRTGRVRKNFAMHNGYS